MKREEIFEYVKKKIWNNTGVPVEKFSGQRSTSSQKWKMVCGVYGD